jgi:fructose-bisphosphate aldolase class 1
MDGEAQGMPVPVFLWEKRGVILFLKVDKAESDGVSLMRPMPELDALLAQNGMRAHHSSLSRRRRDTPSFWSPHHPLARS